MTTAAPAPAILNPASDTDALRLVIVGGVAGGASAAARARRLNEHAEITLFERGKNISFANCGMPYYIGGVIADRDRLLVQTPQAMARRYRVDVRTQAEVLKIDRQAKLVEIRDLATGQLYSQPYDKLILSPGAEPLRPPIPGADSPRVFTLRSLADMDAIHDAVTGHDIKSAVIVGGGYIGLEMAEALRHHKIDVTLVELAQQVFIAADAEMVAPIHQQLQLHGVDLRLGTSVTAIRQSGDALTVDLSDSRSIQVGIVLLSVGVRPEAKLAKQAGLEIGATGGIVVDEHMRTSDPDIYAVGDVIQFEHLVGGHAALLPLAGPANREGRIAADNIFAHPSVYRKGQGTAICKVFDLAIAMTGMSEKELAKAGRRYEKVYVHPANHAGYYPGAQQISLKLLFDPDNGRVLGAQAVGAEGVDKRIDVLATVICAGMTVEDLQDLELAYAPPYSSAKDPVNYAGFVAANARAGDVKLCHVADVLAPAADQMILDVRTSGEVQAGTIPGAKNIPVDELRSRLNELPKDKELLVSCQVGLRGYLACRILTQKGYRCRNLSGGYKTYTAVTGTLPKDRPEENNVTEDTGETGPKAAPAPAAPSVVKDIDARGLQCPGPIMQLQKALAQVAPGQAVRIASTDPGFPADIKGFCHSGGLDLIEMGTADGATVATVAKKTSPAPAAAPVGLPPAKGKTIVVFSGELDKAMAAFIIANGAAAMGSSVTLFFTFWGLNILRKDSAVSVSKLPVERMFGWMMPRGPSRLNLSKMNFAGAGRWLIKSIMARKKVASLPELIASAQAAGVRLVACSMSMDIMGIHREELIDGVEEGGVAAYLDQAESGNVNLFI